MVSRTCESIKGDARVGQERARRPHDGYEQIPPRKVTVKAGEWTTIEIQMRRKP